MTSTYEFKVDLLLSSYKYNRKNVVVAQLVERSLPTPEVHGSNPVIGKYLLTIYLLLTVLEKTKIEIKGLEWPI